MKITNISRAAELLTMRSEIARLRDEYAAGRGSNTEVFNLSPSSYTPVNCDTQSRNGYNLSEAISKLVNHAARQLLAQSGEDIANAAIARIDLELDNIKADTTSETLKLLQKLTP